MALGRGMGNGRAVACARVALVALLLFISLADVACAAAWEGEGDALHKSLRPHEGAGEVAWDSRDSFSPATVRLHSFQPAPLLDMGHLWSQVELRVRCEEEGFAVAFGNSQLAVLALLQEAEHQPPPEASLQWFDGQWRAQLAHAMLWLFSDAKQEVASEALCWWPWTEDQSECVVKLQSYGEKGSMLPRLSWLTEQRPTYIAVSTSDPATRCEMELRRSPRWLSHALLFAAGVLLYRNSSTLGSSLKLYLFSWFLAGTIFSGVAIALVVLYFVARQARLSRMGIVNGIAAFMILSWSSLLVSIRSWVPSMTTLLYNRYLVGFMLLGGVVGFIRGYKSELSQENKDIMRMFFKIVAVCLVYFSSEHP